MGLGAAIILLSLAVLGGCPLSDEDTGIMVKIGKVEITNIPKTVGGKESYKVFVRVSTGDNASAGWVAKGAIEIGDTTSSDFVDRENKPWTVTGTYNVAIVVSPKEVTTWQDIVAYGGLSKDFSSENPSFNLAHFVNLNVSMPTQVSQLFNGKDIKGNPLPNETGIICVPESGIDYPGKPSP
ncbi:MAG: hypothetical protein LBB68_07155 [Treponema sp.]|nr:hypothetical protein [Treponema sp.]